MDYGDFKRRVKELPFIQDDNEADATLKAVLGTWMSRMDDSHARALAAKLPDPLEFERLHSHRRKINEISSQEMCAEIQNQFHLKSEESAQLVNTVIHTTKEAIGFDALHQVETGLPSDWIDLIEKA